MLSAEWFADFDPRPEDWFRIHLVALIVSIVVGLPIFYLIFDLIGRALGDLSIRRPVLTIRTKVFLIGALVPLLMDTLLVQYYWSRTGFFTWETFGIWLALELAALYGTLIFVRSFGQSLRPLEEYVLADGSPAMAERSALTPQSTDELGVITSRFAELLQQQRILEERLVHSGKMEAAGYLAAGVAHDFNNLLFVILSYAEQLRMEVPDEDSQAFPLDQITTAAQQATALTKRLLAFGRGQPVVFAPIDLNKVLGDLTGLLRPLAGEDIELRLTLSNDPVVVMADRGQLEQILLNLAANARDAMVDGGTLIIATDRTTYSVAGHDTAMGVLTMADDGVGMDEATLARVFEPFFTTKEIGTGTGLGLATAYAIVAQHDGTISASSAPGEGTAFTITLPVTDTEVVALPAAERTAPIGGGETILLAEDEQAVRELMTACLREAGYRVLTAENGEDAARLFSDHEDTVDLVVLDAIMPIINGQEAYEQIHSRRPQIPVLMVSGYSGGVLDNKRGSDRDIPMLDKPFTSHTFLAKVRELLDSSP